MAQPPSLPTKSTKSEAEAAAKLCKQASPVGSLALSVSFESENDISSCSPAGSSSRSSPLLDGPAAAVPPCVAQLCDTCAGEQAGGHHSSEPTGVAAVSHVLNAGPRSSNTTGSSCGIGNTSHISADATTRGHSSSGAGGSVAAGMAGSRAVAGFAVLDPMHKDGKVVGYYANVVRTRASANAGTAALLVQEVLAVLRSEQEQEQGTAFAAQARLGAKKQQQVRRKKKAKQQQLLLLQQGQGGAQPDAGGTGGKAAAAGSAGAAESEDADAAGQEQQEGGGKVAKQGFLLSLGLSPLYCLEEEVDPTVFRHCPRVSGLDCCPGCCPGCM